MKNKYWKYICLLVLAFNIAIIAVIGIQVTKHRDQKILDNVSVIKGVNKVADISTNTEQRHQKSALMFLHGRAT